VNEVVFAPTRDFSGRLRAMGTTGVEVGQRFLTLHFTDKERLLPMAILTMLVIGLVVGIVAKFLMPGKDPGGFIITILLGIAGSFLAHYVGAHAGWYSEGQPAGFIAAVVGAIVLLLIYRLLFNRRRA
jgi:uncharacterized membrane protein YeaQ/YmgE (transglycosylase-associated protein family)